MTAPWDRPDLAAFVVGAVYRESDGGYVVEFLGRACVPELNSEDVGVFRFVDQSAGCLIATLHGYDNGQRFRLIQDEIAEELDDL